MKTHTPEYIEGPEALTRFEDTMRVLFSTAKPNTSVVKEKPKKLAHKKNRKRKG